MILGRGFRRRRRIGRRLGSGCWRLSGKKNYDMLCQLGRHRGKGGDGNVTWLLCWTDSCTIGVIASSRSLIIVMAVKSYACVAEFSFESDVRFPA